MNNKPILMAPLLLGMTFAVGCNVTKAHVPKYGIERYFHSRDNCLSIEQSIVEVRIDHKSRHVCIDGIIYINPDGAFFLGEQGLRSARLEDGLAGADAVWIGQGRVSDREWRRLLRLSGDYRAYWPLEIHGEGVIYFSAIRRQMTRFGIEVAVDRISSIRRLSAGEIHSISPSRLPAH